MSNRKSIDHKILEERLGVYEAIQKAKGDAKPLVTLNTVKDIEKEVARLIQTYQGFSKDDLLRMYATQRVRMHLKWQALDAQIAKTNVLEAQLKKGYEKRRLTSANKQIKTEKFAPHIKNKS